jgi:GTPase SAR1 family protein
VDDDEGKQFAKEINAIFQKTSAKESEGIDELFQKIGKKVIDPDKFESKQTGNDNNNNKVKIDKDTKSNKPKKGCC